MNAKDVLRGDLGATQRLLHQYVADLVDDDLYVRPVPGANHIAWQLGHLLISEATVVGENVPGAVYPRLPDGFAQRHAREAASQEGTQGLATKREYLELFDQTRKTTLTALDRLSDTGLDKPSTGRMASFCPRVGDLFSLACNHTMMHAGQFTTVRRKLGKPIIF